MLTFVILYLIGQRPVQFQKEIMAIKYKSIFSQRNITKALIAMVAVLALSACSAHRNSTTQGSSTRRVKAKNIAEVAALAETYNNWSTFYAPFSMQCVQPMSMSVSGRATMVRNEYVYLSLRMIGFEVASVYVDKDSAIVADKYHKVVVAEPLTSLTARTSLTIGDIQDILLGRAFYPGKGNLSEVDMPESLFSPMGEGDTIVLMPRRIPEGASWFFTIDSTPALRGITIEPAGYSPFLVDFSEIFEGAAGSVAQNVVITGEINTRPIEAMFQWNLGKAKWNEPVNEPSLTFKGYQRLSAPELMESLKHNF